MGTLANCKYNLEDTMIRWLKRLFRKPEDPPRTPLGDLITQLAENLAEKESAKALPPGCFLAPGEKEKLIKELEHRLRNPGEHQGQIPVRVVNMVADLEYRNSQSHGSSSSSPISDVRVKTNVRPLGHALDITMALRGVEFDWKDDEFPELNLRLYPEVGLVAQEVEKLLPTIVRENAEGYKTVNYACIVPVLIEAMKEQQLSIKKLQDRLYALEDGIQ